MNIPQFIEKVNSDILIQIPDSRLPDVMSGTGHGNNEIKKHAH
ncbi:MAG: hypothetical protein ABIB04_04455 [Patescibacteria group bacterium]